MAISAGTVAAALTLETGQFEKGMNTARSMMSVLKGDGVSASEKLSLIGKTAASLGGVMTAAVTTPLVAAGTAATKTFMDFDDAMRQVRATMNASEEDTARLTEAAKKYGAETRYSASEAASALNYLALAGYDANKSIEALPVVLRLAQAGGLDLAYASDLVTDSMSALGLEMGELGTYTDQMAKTAQKSNTSVGQLGEAILQVGGTAKGLKDGTVELNAALGILADNGIKGAEGGTHLRNMMLRLQGPTKEGAAALAKYTNGVYDADGRMRRLNDIFGELRASMDQLTDEERSQVLGDIFRVTDLAAAQAMVAGAGERFDELSASIRESKGAAQEMADVMEGGIGGSFRNLKSATEGLAIEIGEVLAPTVQDAANWVTGAARSFAGLDEGMKKTIVSAAGVAAAAGPVMTIGGKIMSRVAKMLPMVKTLTGYLNGPAALPAVGAAAAVAILNACDAADDGLGRLQARLKANVDESELEAYTEGLELAKKELTQEVDVDVELHDNLSEQTVTLYDDIYTWLTDGVPDTEEQSEEMKRRVMGYYDSLLEKIDLDESEEKRKLQKQLDAGLIDMRTFTAKTQNVTDKANAARQDVESLREETLNYIDNYAGAPTAVVQQAYDEIEGLEVRAQGLVDKVAEASAEMRGYAENYETLVKAGETTDQRAIGYATASVSLRTAESKEEIRQSAQAAVEELNATADEAIADAMAQGDEEGAAKIAAAREKREQKLLDQMGEDLAKADKKGALEMQEVLSGAAKAFPEAYQALEESMFQSDVDDLLDRARSGELLGLEDLPDRVREGLEEQYQDVFEELEEYSFTEGEVSDKIRHMLEEVFEGFEQTEALDNLPADSGLDTVLKGVLDNGLMDSIDGIDIASPESMLRLLMGELVTEGMGDMPEEGQTQASLFTAAIGTGIENGQDDVTGQAKAVGGAAWKAAQAAGMNNSTGFALGRNFGKGMAGGILAEVASVEAAAEKMGKSGATVLAATIKAKSPSRVTRELGQFFAQGWVLGIKDGYFDAETAAAGLAKLPKGGDAGAGRGAEIGGPVYNISVNGATIRSEDEAEALIRTATRVRARTNRGYGY